MTVFNAPARTWAILLLGTAAFTSCNQNTENDESASAIAETLVEREMQALASEELSEVLEVRSIHPNGCFEGPFNPFGPPNNNWAWPACAEVNDSGSDSDPRTIHIAFADGCTGPSGQALGGAMTIEILGGDSILAIGDSRSVTHSNLQRGNRTINGTRSRSVAEVDANGQPTFQTAHNMTFSHGWGSVVQSGGGTRDWVAGHGTPMDCSDDIWVRNFQATWTGPQGNGTSRIVEGLTWNGECGYLVAGTITINRPMHNVVIDFGSGECDAIAEVHHNGNVFEIDLNQWN